MSGKTNKKNKDDLADFFLSNDKAESSQQKTTVLNPLKSVEPDEEPEISTEENTKSFSAQKPKEVDKTQHIQQSKESIKASEPYVPSPTHDVAPRDHYVSRENIDPSLYSLEAAVKQSEFLRIAQNKVKSLEKLVDELKSENETLTASAVVLQKKFDQTVNQLDNIKQDHKSQSENLKDEMVLKDRVIKELQKERDELQRKNDEFSSLMSEKIQHVRVRERELQNRLEILQHEGDVVITNKDEMILDLKKQIDQLHFEMDSYKNQARELNQEIQSQKDQIRRSTKALRLALTLLENENIDTSEIKKTGT